MTAHDRLHDAQQRHTAAVELLDALNQQIEAGDETATAQELAARQSLVTFTGQQVEAARRSVASADADRTRDEIIALGDEAVATAGVGEDRLAAAVKTAYDALLTCFDLAAERNDRHRSLTSRLQVANDESPGLLAQHTAVRDLAQGHGFGYGFAVQEDQGRREIRHVDAASVVMAAAAAALEARTSIADHMWTDLHSALVFQPGHTVFAELPWIAPAEPWRHTY